MPTAAVLEIACHIAEDKFSSIIGDLNGLIDKDLPNKKAIKSCLEKLENTFNNLSDAHVKYIRKTNIGIKAPQSKIWVENTGKTIDESRIKAPQKIEEAAVDLPEMEEDYKLKVLWVEIEVAQLELEVEEVQLMSIEQQQDVVVVIAKDVTSE